MGKGEGPHVGQSFPPCAGYAEQSDVPVGIARHDVWSRLVVCDERPARLLGQLVSREYGRG